jgi:hypothetical protein
VFAVTTASALPRGVPQAPRQAGLPFLSPRHAGLPFCPRVMRRFIFVPASRGASFFVPASRGASFLSPRHAARHFGPRVMRGFLLSPPHAGLPCVPASFGASYMPRPAGLRVPTPRPRRYGLAWLSPRLADCEIQTNQCNGWPALALSPVSLAWIYSQFAPTVGIGPY